MTDRSTPASARAVPKLWRSAVGVAGGDAGLLPVVAKDAAQSFVGEGLSAMGALGHDEQGPLSGLGSLGQQVGLHEPGHVGIERDPAFLVALADHPDPAPADVDIGDAQAEHLGAAQSREQHQPGDRPITIACAELPEQGLDLLAVESPREPASARGHGARNGTRGRAR